MGSRAVLAIAGLLASTVASAQSICTECIKIRVRRPGIARGPAADELDTKFNEIRLPDGSYRGFTANGHTYAVDGRDPWSMGGPRTPVLAPGAAGTYNECGQWLNGTELSGGVVYGFIHAERSCNYALNQTHKSMGMATSADFGMSWTPLGQFLTGTDAPTAGMSTGEGDCGIVNGQDGWLYAYCLRLRDWKTIVARARLANPTPGNWYKFLNGVWTSPGLGGDATGLDASESVARWRSQNLVAAFSADRWFGGVKLQLSADKTAFSTVPEPLIPLDDVNWSRPAPTELVAYLSTTNFDDGSNQLDDAFQLAYVYLQPGEAFDKRYLVLREVLVTMTPQPVNPQVGLELGRWYSASNKDRWTTTGPVPGNFSSYAWERSLGFLMTRPASTQNTTKLEECVSQWPGHPDHLLTGDGECSSNGYTRLRTAGWVYTTQQPNTIPLYRCYNATEMHHFASNQADCEGLGQMEWRLGYLLQN
ncbi:hypothetical protein F0U60_18235 [Archangium minus]|uniref:Uncharacterized protein n=1 Tax=Archangium minus TaxID=83450 RepID=A0ABY9WPV8_9BACT|nr:hypothetical protein F0U60_18235 [Archangium minus]